MKLLTIVLTTKNEETNLKKFFESINNSYFKKK